MQEKHQEINVNAQTHSNQQRWFRFDYFRNWRTETRPQSKILGPTVSNSVTLAKPETTNIANSNNTIIPSSPSPSIQNIDTQITDGASVQLKRSRSQCNLKSLQTFLDPNVCSAPYTCPTPNNNENGITESVFYKTEPTHNQPTKTLNDDMWKEHIYTESTEKNTCDTENTDSIDDVRMNILTILNKLSIWKRNAHQRRSYQWHIEQGNGNVPNSKCATNEADNTTSEKVDFHQLTTTSTIGGSNISTNTLTKVRKRSGQSFSQMRRRRSSYYFSDNERRIRANGREFNAQFKYADNYIKTSKYSWLTFLPLNLLEQFQRLANFYFLCLLVLQLIPAISSLTPVTTAIPLIGVLTLTAVKDAYDDIQRHLSDSQVNNRRSKALKNGNLIDERWSGVQVGDVIRLENNQFVAADILLLTTSEPNGLCFIETAELDGETNLKCKQCLPETSELGQNHDALWAFNGEIICERPNNLLNKFEGTLMWKHQRYALDNEKILLRGCVLRNTQWCYGVVIFAGKDTKLMQNSGKTQFKSTGVDRLLNFIIIGIVLFLLSICAFFTLACAIWEGIVGQHFQVYLPWENIIPKDVSQGAAVIGLLVFFSYAIVLNTVVPISLYVSVEVIRFAQSFLINWDQQMYYEPTKTNAKARTTTLNEELGQIQYIFSDKTGTLTQNIMTFNKCSINGRSYGDVIDLRTGEVMELSDKHKSKFQASSNNSSSKNTTAKPNGSISNAPTILLHTADVHPTKSLIVSTTSSPTEDVMDIAARLKSEQYNLPADDTKSQSGTDNDSEKSYGETTPYTSTDTEATTSMRAQISGSDQRHRRIRTVTYERNSTSSASERALSSSPSPPSSRSSRKTSRIKSTAKQKTISNHSTSSTCKPRVRRQQSTLSNISDKVMIINSDLQTDSTTSTIKIKSTSNNTLFTSNARQYDTINKNNYNNNILNENQYKDNSNCRRKRRRSYVMDKIIRTKSCTQEQTLVFNAINSLPNSPTKLLKPLISSKTCSPIIEPTCSCTDTRIYTTTTANGDATHLSPSPSCPISQKVHRRSQRTRIRISSLQPKSTFTNHNFKTKQKAPASASEMRNQLTFCAPFRSCRSRTHEIYYDSSPTTTPISCQIKTTGTNNFFTNTTCTTENIILNTSSRFANNWSTLSTHHRVHAVEPVDFSNNPEYEPDFRWYDTTLLDAVRSDEEHAHNFFRLLALCHTVMPEYVDGRLEYQAQSPDESALVSAARNFGFVFRSRTPNSITIEVMGKTEEYELLNILDFNNVRKRMSVILRRSNSIILYCKGADNVIYDRLSSSQNDMKARTQEHLNKFAGEGLRTLVLAERRLDLDYFNDWSRRQQDAAVSLDEREDKLSAIYEEIESEMVLVGVTAIEDKLQDGVPQTIANLQMAGIKIWVLTGDKQETAINIGYSCQLLTDDLADVFVVDGSSLEEVDKQLRQFKESIRIVNRFKPSSFEPTVNLNMNGEDLGSHGSTFRTKMSPPPPPAISVVTFRWDEDQIKKKRYKGEPDSAECNELYDTLEKGDKSFTAVHPEEIVDENTGFAIVINGHSLVYCLSPELETRFLDIASQCKAVICCRVTPLQKALVVELIKRARNAVTLAIGDGANDVSMIKAAHIGVGISGQEGLQAVLASDYSIAQFRYLERLLLVHGRWSYYRMCKFLRYFFYKNFAFTLCHCWYSFFCGFSAQTVFDPMFISVYNLFYTSLPVLALGVFEQDVSDKHSVEYPKLYTPGLKSQLFNTKEFVYSVLHGAFSSLILFLIPYGTYKDGVSPNGLILSDHMTLGAVVATILIIDNTAQIALYTSYWTIFNHITIWGSLIWYFVLDYFYNYVIGGPYVGSLSAAMKDLTFWATMFITVTMLMAPVLAYKFCLIDIYPSLADKIRLKRRQATQRSRQISSVMRTPSSRRARRSLRSGYAFAHQEGFGRLITSGKIMRKLPQEFAFPLGLGSKKQNSTAAAIGVSGVVGGGVGAAAAVDIRSNNEEMHNNNNSNIINNNNNTRDNENASLNDLTNSNDTSNGEVGYSHRRNTTGNSDDEISPRAPYQDLDTINL